MTGCRLSGNRNSASSALTHSWARTRNFPRRPSTGTVSVINPRVVPDHTIACDACARNSQERQIFLKESTRVRVLSLSVSVSPVMPHISFEHVRLKGSLRNVDFAFHEPYIGLYGSLPSLKPRRRYVISLSPVLIFILSVIILKRII